MDISRKHLEMLRHAVGLHVETLKWDVAETVNLPDSAKELEEYEQLQEMLELLLMKD